MERLRFRWPVLRQLNIHNHGGGVMSCRCFIIPDDVLRRFAADPELADEVRQSLHRTAELSRQVRAVREQHALLTLTAISLPGPPTPSPAPAPHAPPAGQVFDCHTGTSLPGTP